MIGRSRVAGIRCPTGLFPRQREEIARLSQAMGQAPTTGEKGALSQMLIEALEVLLACTHPGGGGNADCHLCRQVSELRHKTARLVVRAGELDGHRR